MRLASIRALKFRCVMLVIAVLFVIPLVVAEASSTNVFLAKNSLQGEAYTPDGISTVKFKGKTDLFLGTNTTAVLAIAVSDMDCLPNGPAPKVSPTIRIVSYDRATEKIVATLVEFINIIQLSSKDGEILIQAYGIGGSGVAGAKLDALITLRYQPCNTSAAPTTPNSVTIEPLGIVKPIGTPPFNAGITGDEGAVLLFTDDPNNPVLQIDVSGVGTYPSPFCDIAVNTEALSFGTVVVGTNSTQSFSIRNNGAIDCTVASIIRNGGSAFTFVSPAQPFGLPAGTAITIPVTYAPTTNGADSAILRVTSTDPDPEDAQQYITLTGNGSATTPCNINVAPLLLNFGTIEIGASLTIPLTVSNSGGTTCTVDRLTLLTQSTDFSMPTNAFSVAPGTSTVVSVTYTPADAGSDTGVLEVDSNDSDNRLILVNLTASGVTPACSLQVAPTALDFGTVIVGTNRDLSISITNGSLATCSVNSINLTGDPSFTLVPTVSVPFNILPGANTNLIFQYTPTGGAVSGTATINSGSPSHNTVISLKGVGAIASPSCSLPVSESAINFGDVAVGSTNVLKFNISNSSPSNCLVQALTISGSTDYSLIAPPQPILVTGTVGYVEIGVRYSPGTPGADLGTLQIIRDDTDPVVLIPLTGNGVQPVVQVIPTNYMNFGSVLVKTESTMSVTLQNISTVNATITSLSKNGSGDFLLDPIVPRSQFILTPGATAEVPVTYLPSNQGGDTGAVVVAGNSANLPLSINLVGTGVQCNLTNAPSELSFGKTQLNLTNTLIVTVSNTGNTNCPVTGVEILGSSFFSVSNAIPFDVEAGEPVQVSVDYTPVNVQTIVIRGGTVKSSGKPTLITP